MNASLEPLIALARALPRDQQVELAEELLDLPHFSGAYDIAWMDEIERRRNELKVGRAQMFPWPDVQADAKAILESY